MNRVLCSRATLASSLRRLERADGTSEPIYTLLFQWHGEDCSIAASLSCSVYGFLCLCMPVYLLSTRDSFLSMSCIHPCLTSIHISYLSISYIYPYLLPVHVFDFIASSYVFMPLISIISLPPSDIDALTSKCGPSLT